MDETSAPADETAWITGGADLDVLFRELAHFGDSEGPAADRLVPLVTKGLNHAHVRVAGSGMLLRIPRLSAFGFAPDENLAYQSACFARAGPSNVIPMLHGRIAPGPGIPWGALLVERISGDTPRLPDDLPLIARSLAAVHSLPPPEETPPLLVHRDPVRATLEVIAAQARFLDGAGLRPDSRRQLDEELGRAPADVPAGPDHPVTLVGTDTHPGNFLVDRGGRAIFLDLEKMLYGSPAIDLAHATIYTSTMWDPDIATALTAGQTAEFHDAYFDALPAELGDRIRPWIGAMRRLTWLRTMTWFAKWRAESAGGASWSAALGQSGLRDALERRFEDYFDPANIERVRKDLGETPRRQGP